jgi:hypothetical protein
MQMLTWRATLTYNHACKHCLATKSLPVQAQPHSGCDVDGRDRLQGEQHGQIPNIRVLEGERSKQHACTRAN